MDSNGTSCSVKRIRMPNYTPEEVDTLMNILQEFKQVFDYTKPNAVSWKQKEQAWYEITASFNSQSRSLVYRSMESLKKCYENKKKEIRKTTRGSGEKKLQFVKIEGPVVDVPEHDVKNVLRFDWDGIEKEGTELADLQVQIAKQQIAREKMEYAAKVSEYELRRKNLELDIVIKELQIKKMKMSLESDFP